MQKDSIREHLSKDDIVTTIQMELSAAEKTACIVLVEGEDDITFVKRTFEESVICYESFSGKAGLDELIQDERLKRNEVIAIRDKDYMDISHLPRRMFVYDCCCMEMMLLACKEVASAFFDIYYSGSQSKQDYIIHAMRQLAPYSFLRQKNETGVLKIDFKAGFADLLDGSGNLDIKALFARIKRETELNACALSADEAEDGELWNITNGHDICKMFGSGHRKGRKKLGEDGVRQVLLSSFRKSDFKTTKLYQDIKTYQDTYDLKYVD